jgi:arylformamidase
VIDRPPAAPSLDARHWHDISVPLYPGVPEWPGDVQYSCGWTLRRSTGDSVNLSSITTSLHAGTHADAPLHVEDGWASSDALPLEAFSGDALVVDLQGEDGPVTLARLERDGPVRGARRVLLRTGFTVADGAFPDEWPWLDGPCCSSLCDAGLALLGVDCPSVDSKLSKTLPVHHTLFSRGAFNLENLDLRAVMPGRYALIALPLRINGLDAAPVRAVLSPR